jgi:hypothetical protein
VSLISHDPTPNDVVDVRALAAETTMSAGRGIMRLHGVLRHSVPPAPMVPPRGAGCWLSLGTQVPMWSPPSKQQTATPYALQGQRPLVPFPTLLRNRVS